MEKQRKTNGITLIALVITIIILLILAGVAIVTLTGENGVLGKAEKAKTENIKKSAEEKVKIEVIGSYSEDGTINLEDLNTNLRKIEGLTDILSPNGTSIMNQNKIEKLPIDVVVDGYIIEISENREVKLKEIKPIVTYTLSTEETVPEGTKITVTIKATISEGSITKITTPAGEANNTNTTTFDVTKNGFYNVIVEGSNGKTTTCVVKVLNIGNAEIFSDIYTESQVYKDKNGNIAQIPKGFAVGISSTINTIEKGLVITDKINELHYSTGNQFVWIPCGEVKTASSGTKTINFNRYSFNSEGVPKAIGEAGVPTTSGSSWIKAYEYVKPDYDVRPAKDLVGFKTSVQKNGGFYFGRYEAGDPTATTWKTSNGPFTATPACKASLFPYGYVYQAEASNLSKKMYPDSNSSFDVTSDLVNSYAWDTTLAYIYECSEDKKYATKGFQISGERHKTGQTKGGTVDKICNIFDMAGNYYEYSTETSTDANWCRTLRGGCWCSSNETTGSRSTNSIPYSSRTEEYCFRPIVYFKN